MLVTDLELTPWCPVHVVPLQATRARQPKLRFDQDRCSWFVDLNTMWCPSTSTQGDCITKWIIDVRVDEITPEQARARAKTETGQ